jgi:phosphoribosylformylglycinamidine cyclo-ligase
MTKRPDLSYSDAGVDIDFAASCLSEIDKTRSRSAEVITGINDFAGLFSIKSLCQRFDDPVLVSSTDGVGTKLLVAILCEHYDGIGQDLVAMCVNDIITKGAEPLFFLDYFATAHLRSVPFIKIVNSMVTACDEVDCALIGGETAEMPSLYAHKHFDLAGFTVGVAERANLLGCHRVKNDDVLLGVSSSGLHANGFSLVRKIMFEQLKHKPHDVLWQTARSVKTVANELLTPTKLYVNPVKALLKNGIIPSAIAHITGGGISENVPRILPRNLMASIDISEVDIPPIFSYLMEQGPVSADEMFRTFNMGVGLIIAISKDRKSDAISLLEDFGETVYEVGRIHESEGGLRCRVKM